MDENENGSLRSSSSSHSAAGDRPIYLRALSSKAPVHREDVRLLWQKGLVAGLFNIPTEAVFEACTDFCIESPVAESSKDIVKMLGDQSTKNAELTNALRKAVLLGLESRRELEALMESSRERASQILLLEEQFRDYEKQTTADRKKHKTLSRKLETLENQLGTATTSLNRSLEDVKRLESDNKRLSTSLSKTTDALTTIQGAKATLEQKLAIVQSKCAELEASQAKHITHVAGMDLATVERKLEVLEAEKMQLLKRDEERHLEAQAREESLQAQVQSLSQELSSLQDRYTLLSTQASRLQTENFELRASNDSPVDQNDILNQRLLSHYRYLVTLTEDQDSDDGTPSDAEAWL